MTRLRASQFCLCKWVIDLECSQNTDLSQHKAVIATDRIDETFNPARYFEYFVFKVTGIFPLKPISSRIPVDFKF